jgi:hypothetical protein
MRISSLFGAAGVHALVILGLVVDQQRWRQQEPQQPSYQHAQPEPPDSCKDLSEHFKADDAQVGQLLLAIASDEGRDALVGVSFRQPMSHIMVSDPEVLDVAPVNGHSIVFRGRKQGFSTVSIFPNDNSVPIKLNVSVDDYILKRAEQSPGR